MPITGSGEFYANFTNGMGQVRLIGGEKKINGKVHFILSKLDIKITVEKGKIIFENLFGGQKALGDTINKIINDNFDVFALDLIPLIEKSLGRIFKNTSNKIFKRFTKEQLFP